MPQHPDKNTHNSNSFASSISEQQKNVKRIQKRTSPVPSGSGGSRGTAFSVNKTSPIKTKGGAPKPINGNQL